MHASGNEEDQGVPAVSEVAEALQDADALAKKVDALAMIVLQLCRRLTEDDPCRMQALKYLEEHGIMPSLLRKATEHELVACNYCGSKCIDRDRFPLKDFCNECERTQESLRCRNCQNTGIGLQGESCKCGCTTYRDILEHTLGANSDQRGFRNYFDAPADHDDWPTIIDMVKAGYMKRGKDTLFKATESGAKLLGFTDMEMRRAGIKGHRKA